MGTEGKLRKASCANLAVTPALSLTWSWFQGQRDGYKHRGHAQLKGCANSALRDREVSFECEREKEKNQKKQVNTKKKRGGKRKLKKEY